MNCEEKVCYIDTRLKPFLAFLLSGAGDLGDHGRASDWAVAVMEGAARAADVRR